MSYIFKFINGPKDGLEIPEQPDYENQWVFRDMDIPPVYSAFMPPVFSNYDEHVYVLSGVKGSDAYYVFSETLTVRSV